MSIPSCRRPPGRAAPHEFARRLGLAASTGPEWHYYAHLDSFGTFREGDIVHAGDVLGYVGNTGNARGTPAHLHYGIYRDAARNPYPRLIRDEARSQIAD